MDRLNRTRYIWFGLIADSATLFPEWVAVGGFWYVCAKAALCKHTKTASLHFIATLSHCKSQFPRSSGGWLVISNRWNYATKCSLHLILVELIRIKQFCKTFKNEWEWGWGDIDDKRFAPSDFLLFTSADNFPNLILSDLRTLIKLHDLHVQHSRPELWGWRNIY